MAEGDEQRPGPEPAKSPVIPRTERVLPGVWRLRLPCPWPGVPHVNAWALRRGDGVVLFDTGIGGPGGRGQLEHALRYAGYSLADVQLVVATHAHADHFGAAGTVVDASGCDLWMHPAWTHIRTMVEDPDQAWERRIEVARQSGVPSKALARYEERREEPPVIDRIIEPAEELVPGVEIETDIGTWEVHETPGHAPSHVVLHQPERKLMISGDHLLGRVSLFFDFGHTSDPVAEFGESLDRVAGLETDLCLAGHGRPFRDVPAKIEANRTLAAEQLARVRQSLDSGPKPAFETVPDLLGDFYSPATAGWGLQLALAYLNHLELVGEAGSELDGDQKLWSPA
ncbi:MAG TPA: MBL fold metallo-hydrolase [Solirubrobacterales bacterium]|nr:MBL fold metallo-hydrolase [Solirubrobacterales bacterium]